MIPAELDDNSRMERVVYQTTTAQVVRATIALILTVVLAYMLLSAADVTREFFILYGLILGTYFEVPKPQSGNRQ